MPVLRCKVLFFSTGDEKAFFGFAEGIKAVRKVSGEGDEILLQVVSRPSQASLRDLIALFYRYEIEMSQLRQFCSPSNRHWFQDPQNRAPQVCQADDDRRGRGGDDSECSAIPSVTKEV